MSTLGRHRKDLDRLSAVAAEMISDLEARHGLRERDSPDRAESSLMRRPFEKQYQSWYTEAHALLKQVLPDRLPEFVACYQPPPPRKNFDALTFVIQDYLNGFRSATSKITGKLIFDDLGTVLLRLTSQVAIFQSATARFESSLFEIRQLVTADLLDSELDESAVLLKQGFVRAAGAVAGVVVEKHLGEVCSNHNVSIKKKDPAISDLNDALKTAGVYGVPEWRFIQHLGDLRNLCDHNKAQDPTSAQVQELLAGVTKVTKTIF